MIFVSFINGLCDFLLVISRNLGPVSHRF